MFIFNLLQINKSWMVWYVYQSASRYRDFLTWLAEVNINAYPIIYFLAGTISTIIICKIEKFIFLLRILWITLLWCDSIEVHETKCPFKQPSVNSSILMRISLL